MRILLVNLTRFGDLLQTQAVIHGLRKAGHDVGMACLSNFASAASLLDGLTHVAPLPGNALLAALDADAPSAQSPLNAPPAGTHDGWLRALGTLHTWADGVRAAFCPDVILNLTASSAARLLAQRLAANVPVRGFGLDAHGYGRATSAWAAFMEASSRTRGCSPFNIVDVFLRTAELPGPAHFALRTPPAEAAASLLPPADTRVGYIAFQLGASEVRRQWPAAFFAWLGTHLLEHCKLMPVLLGTEAERPLAEAYIASGGPGIDLVGRTTIPELAAVLSRTRMLVTNDTGTMHLAAGLGTPILALFLATAQPWDTGPYLADACTLEPDLPCHPCGFGSRCTHSAGCTTHITPEVVWPLLRTRLQTGIWTCPPETAAVARVWVSRRDPWGYMDLHPLSGQDSADRTIWTGMQRRIYRHFLDEADRLRPDSAFLSCVPQTQEALHTPDGTYDLTRLAGKLSPTVRTDRAALLEQAVSLLHLIHEQGRLTLMRPSGPNGQRFLASCLRLGALFDSHDAFNVLGRTWQVMSQEHGDNLASLLAFSTLLQRHLAVWQHALTV